MKLTEDSFLVRDESDPTVQVEITAQNDNSAVNEISEVFTLTVLINESPFHNEELPQDVNHSGDVTAQDALLIINFLNTHGPGPIGPGDPAVCYDVNGDGLVTALDALLVLNFLNRSSVPPQAEGEAESIANDEPMGPSQPVQPTPVAPQRSLANPGLLNEADESIEVAGPVLPVAELKKLAATPVASNNPTSETIVDWVLRQRGSDVETESQIDQFLSSLTDDDDGLL